MVSTYDGARLLTRQLSALAGQEWDRPWEVIVSDNGSTDGTPQLALSFADRLPSLRVVDASARQGVGHARNVGATEARGDLLLFVDQDDEVAPGYVAAMAAGLNDGDLVAARIDHAALNAGWKRLILQDQGDGLIIGQWRFLPWAGGCSLGMHRHLLDRLGGFEESLRYAQDVDLCWRAQLVGASIGFVPEAVLRYQHRDTLWACISQAREWGTEDPELYSRYRAHGMREIPAGPRGLAGLAVGGIRARSRIDVAIWLIRIGRYFGRFQGRQRVAKALHACGGLDLKELPRSVPGSEKVANS